MTLRYYMDVHVPSVITESLWRRGIDVLTSQEDGTREKRRHSVGRSGQPVARVASVNTTARAERQCFPC